MTSFIPELALVELAQVLWLLELLTKLNPVFSRAAGRDNKILVWWYWL